MPDPVPEDQVKLELTWKANSRTRKALERPDRLMQFAGPTEYMLDIIASTLAPHEADTRLEQRRAGLCFEPPFQPRLVLLQRGFEAERRKRPSCS